MTTIAVITGNPKPASRTHTVALAAADALAKEIGETGNRLVIDLADHAPALFDYADPELTRLTDEVAAADIVITASPTYKAAFTGMLKAFLDRFLSNGLAGVTAVPVMTGGWPGHLLAVELHLRPVLIELGATVPARGLYVTEPELADLDKAITRWSETAAPLIATSAGAQRRRLARTLTAGTHRPWQDDGSICTAGCTNRSVILCRGLIPEPGSRSRGLAES